MSAIAGIIRLDGRPIEPATVARMQEKIAPYGRDRQQHWQQASAALIHAQLRITTEDDFDCQPLVDAESGLVVVFDGRLDNREELAQAFGLSRDALTSMADSELVLRACARWDTAALERLLGDFALACWQPKRRRLWLAREPLGHRPLFWHRQANIFAFATLPKALFAIPGVPRALCEERLLDHLMFLPTVGPESFFKDVFRVEPGEFVVLEDARVTTRRYHRFDPEREIRLGNDDDYLEAFREQLERAVARRLRSAGPVASHLSSGFDSSTVTALAARQLANRNERLTAYTAVPGEHFRGSAGRGRHADEGPGARAVAARFANIDHVLIRPAGTSPIDQLRSSTEVRDRAPLDPSNAVWIQAIQSDAMRRGAKVILIGKRGNASISYTGESLLPALFGRLQWIHWWQEMRALQRTQSHRPLSSFVAHSLAPYLPAAVWLLANKCRQRTLDVTAYSAVHPKFMARMRSGERVRSRGWDMSYRPMASGRRLRIAMLTRGDNADYFAAANATACLETRDPTADLRLVEFCLAVPDSQYLRNGETRWLLRRMMHDVLPPEILHSRTRGLQAADWYESAGAVRSEMHRTLTQMRQQGIVGEYLDLEALQRSLDHWPESGWNDQAIKQVYRRKLLHGLSVGTFIQYASEHQGEPLPCPN